MIEWVESLEVYDFNYFDKMMESKMEEGWGPYQRDRNPRFIRKDMPETELEHQDKILIPRELEDFIGISGSDFLVYLYFCDVFGGQIGVGGEVGYLELEKHLKLTRPTVSKSLKSLIVRGLIYCDKGCGRGRKSYYELA